MIATVSKVQCLNDCKRKFYFQYIEKIPVEQTKALKKGSNVHSLLENIEKYNFEREHTIFFQKIEEDLQVNIIRDDINENEEEGEVGEKDK